MKQKGLKTYLVLLVPALVLAALFAASLVLGRFRISLRELPDLLNGTASETAKVVFFSSRLPRVTAAALIGCGLSVSGAAYQGVFRNPMVSPDILGASAGAGFGAALGLLLGLPQTVTQAMAFTCGLLAVACALLLSHLTGSGGHGGRLLLVL